ncbi:MAG TPA: YoaK family protein [Silvibacterium sp.]|nr:YoaK family protein [Silvibacterium sp.]
MRAIERDFLICMLAATAGAADGWSFFGLGHVFVANMTGNTVLLGMSVFALNGDFLHPLTALICYAAGVIVGSLLTRNVQLARNVQLEGEAAHWPRQVSLTLLLEALLLTAVETAWFSMHPSGVPHPTHNVLHVCVAFAMGLQSAAMLQLKIPGIVTTYITGTWTTFMSGLTRLQSLPPAEKQKFESRLGMQAAVLAVYFISAVLTGYLFRYFPAAVGALPAGSVLLVAIYALARS